MIGELQNVAAGGAIQNATQEMPKTPPSSVCSVSKLMTLTPKEWEERSDTLLNERITQYCQLVPKETTNHAGFLEKLDLDACSEVAVIGDIHGNDLRLVLTLKALQKRGYVDPEYRMLPGKTLVFLGDYLDRGKNSLKVLEIVLTLKIENPNTVYLLRGNHEDLDTIKGNLNGYTVSDPRYRRYLQNYSNELMLADLFKSLSLGVYIGQKSKLEKTEYVHFTHGLFYLYTDPAPLFDTTNAYERLWVDKSAQFSPRIQALMKNKESEKTDKQKKLKESADQLDELSKKMAQVRFDDVYWLDAGSHFVRANFSGRTIISPESVQAYMKISGTKNAKVKGVIRGHQGYSFTLNGSKGKVVVTTIDPSTDSFRHMYMEIRLADKVQDWKKLFIKMPLIEDHERALSQLGETSTLQSFY